MPLKTWFLQLPLQERTGVFIHFPYLPQREGHFFLQRSFQLGNGSKLFDWHCLGRFLLRQVFFQQVLLHQCFINGPRWLLYLSQLVLLADSGQYKVDVFQGVLLPFQLLGNLLYAAQTNSNQPQRLNPGRFININFLNILRMLRNIDILNKLGVLYFFYLIDGRIGRVIAK